MLRKICRPWRLSHDQCLHQFGLQEKKNTSRSYFSAVFSSFFEKIDNEFKKSANYSMGASTISGGPKNFQPEDTQVLMTLDCDKKILEYQLLGEENPFWILQIPEKDKSNGSKNQLMVSYHVFCSLIIRNSWVKFCELVD